MLVEPEKAVPPTKVVGKLIDSYGRGGVSTILGTKA